MTEYKPGTVAKIAHAKYRGDHFLAIRGEDGWFSAAYGFTRDLFVGDVRPLVVLDLGALSADAPHLAIWADAVALLRQYEDRLESALLGDIADQIEAQTKPPRIPEPGLWAVVESGAGRIPIRRWVHHEEGWWVADTGDRLFWEDLDDPTLVREGV